MLSRIVFITLLFVGVLGAQDLPSKGASLLDLFVKHNNGLPYPFSHLLEKLDNFSGNNESAQEGLLIPFGRSLQKPLSNTYNPYLYPRVIAAEGVDSIKSNSTNAKVAKLYNTSSRIFLGFHEPKKQIEVISWNEALGRFEFQIVSDYEQGKRPKIFYANRQVCLSCHQNQGPIFPEIPWLETNANFITAGLIKRARQASGDNQEKYQGVWIQDKLTHTDNDSRSKRARVAQFYESAVFRSDTFLKAQEIWKSSCVISDDKEKCREKFLGFVLLNELLDSNTLDQLFTSVFETFKTEDINQFKKSLIQHTFFLKRRNLTTDVHFSSDLFQTFNASKAEEQIEKLFSRLNENSTQEALDKYAKASLIIPLTHEQDPLQDRFNSDESREVKAIDLIRPIYQSLFTANTFLDNDETAEKKLNLFVNDQTATITTQIESFEQALSNPDDFERTDPPKYEIHHNLKTATYELVDSHPWAKIKRMEIDTNEMANINSLKIFKAVITSIEDKQKTIFCLKDSKSIVCSNKRYDLMTKYYSTLIQNNKYLVNSSIFYDLKISEILLNGKLKDSWENIYHNLPTKKIMPEPNFLELDQKLTQSGMKIIIKSCGRCHYGSDSAATTLFKGETEFELLQTTILNKDKMLKRVKELRNMPPKGSKELLRIHQIPSLRQEIIEALEAI